MIKKNNSLDREFSVGLIWGIAICLVLLIVFFNSWYTINAGERGVMLTFGFR